MKGHVYWDRHDFKHEVRYTLRYITKRWTYSERNELEGGYKLSESYIDMEGGYRLLSILRERRRTIEFCIVIFVSLREIVKTYLCVLKATKEMPTHG